MRSTSRVIIGALFASLVLAGAFASPASAKKPGTVKRVQVTAASTSSLTLTWNKVGGATKHEIFFSTSYSMKKAKKRKAGKTNSYKVTGLSRAKNYCFQVRALRGKSVGKKSQRTCKPTVNWKGATEGTPVRVATFNACMDKCSGSLNRGNLAIKQLRSASPDIIALQEASNPQIEDGLAPEWAGTEYKSAKRLLYKKSKFDLAVDEPTVEEQFEKPRQGYFDLGGKYGVWAELIDKKTSKHFIVTSVHLTSGKGKSEANKRQAETSKLHSETAKFNPRNLTVVHAGDFNSNKSRGSLDTVRPVMYKGGYIDSFDLALYLVNPNWNSSLKDGKPTYGTTWGDHVDHIWVKPAVGVRKWQKLGSLSKPYASDHFPVLVDLIIPNS